MSALQLGGGICHYLEGLMRSDLGFLSVEREAIETPNQSSGVLDVQKLDKL